jgi:hypothetical protein
MNPTLESSIISAGVALLVVLIGQVLVPIVRESRGRGEELDWHDIAKEVHSLRGRIA